MKAITKNGKTQKHVGILDFMDFMLLGSGLEVCAREERVEKGDELTHVVLTALSAKQYYRHASSYLQ